MHGSDDAVLQRGGIYVCKIGLMKGCVECLTIRCVSACQRVLVASC